MKSAGNGDIKNQGEGDRAADRRYRNRVKNFIDKGKAAAAAREAARSVDAEDAARKQDEQQHPGTVKGRREILRVTYSVVARLASWLEGQRARLEKRIAKG